MIHFINGPPTLCCCSTKFKLLPFNNYFINIYIYYKVFEFTPYLSNNNSLNDKNFYTFVIWMVCFWKRYDRPNIGVIINIHNMCRWHFTVKFLGWDLTKYEQYEITIDQERDNTIPTRNECVGGLWEYFCPHIFEGFFNSLIPGRNKELSLYRGNAFVSWTQKALLL